MRSSFFQGVVGKQLNLKGIMNMTNQKDMNILEELYFGNLSGVGKIFERNSDYDKALKLVAENEELLTEALGGKEKNQFLELIDAQGALVCITAKESFIDGFKLGAKLILDTFVAEHKSALKNIC